MAATSFTPNPSGLLTARANLKSYKKTQLGFEPRIEAQKPTRWGGIGFSVGVGKSRGREALQRRRLEVTCTAEGIERGMLVGRRSGGGGGGGGGGEVEVEVKVNVPERLKE